MSGSQGAERPARCASIGPAKRQAMPMTDLFPRGVLDFCRSWVGCRQIFLVGSATTSSG